MSHLPHRKKADRSEGQLRMALFDFGMDTTTLLVIIIIVLLVGGGGCVDAAFALDGAARFARRLAVRFRSCFKLGARIHPCVWIMRSGDLPMGGYDLLVPRHQRT